MDAGIILTLITLGKFLEVRSKGSASVRVHEGDQVWWDRHDWAAAMDVPQPAKASRTTSPGR